MAWGVRAPDAESNWYVVTVESSSPVTHTVELATWKAACLGPEQDLDWTAVTRARTPSASSRTTSILSSPLFGTTNKSDPGHLMTWCGCEPVCSTRCGPVSPVRESTVPLSPSE